MTTQYHIRSACSEVTPCVRLYPVARSTMRLASCSLKS
jgi:hypothetical protein